VVPLGSVLITGVVTGGVAIWSKIIDARSKREDREHAEKLDYEGRAWKAKNEALRRLITACRFVKSQAQRTRFGSTDDEQDQRDRRALTVRALYRFKDRLGGEDVISEITALAAQPVSDALDEMLALGDVQERKHAMPLWILNRIDPQVEASRERKFNDDEGNPTPDAANRLQEHAYLIQEQEKALDVIGSSADIDVDAVIKLCERIIEVACQDFRGRY
jgi:hypothetical protein